MSSHEQSPKRGEMERGTPVLVMPPPHRKPSRWELWRSRLFLGEFVIVCLAIGIILVAAPWTSLWANNSLVAGMPQVRRVLMNDFVRGLISGLGLVDIWLGIAELVH